MNFSLTEDQSAIQAMVRDMAKDKAAPTWSQLAELGLCGVAVPTDLGGTGMGMVELCLCLEALAAGYPSIARTLQVHNLSCIESVLCAGSDKQRAQWIPRLAGGAVLGTYSTTGHDVPHAANAGLIVHNDVIVEGPVKATATRVLGFRGTHPGSIDLTGYPLEKLVGDAAPAMQKSRVGLAAVALGITAGALRHGAEYAEGRQQFGRPISRFQAIRWKIADSALALDAARLTTYRAAWMVDQGKSVDCEAAMARELAVRGALLATDHALQIHGGYGYTTEYPVEELYRDARACSLVDGGPDEARDSIAASLLAQF